MEYTIGYLDEIRQIIDKIDPVEIENMVELIFNIRDKNGRIFFIGAGGGAGNASHAVNDFRKIAGIECYTPTDNVSELTARTNDDGWEYVFVEYLKTSRLNENDMVFVFSVGGGNKEENISANIVHALEFAKNVGSKITGVVGRDGGYTAKVSDSCLVIPVENHSMMTPLTEAFQGVIWHLIVSHPRIAINEMKWESVSMEG
jgi:D-sedoheptulose 7-phosphate isomerase